MSKRKQKSSADYGKKYIDKSKALNYNYHLPVLLHRAVDELVWKPDGVYIDGTLGGGGHTAEIYRRLGSKGSIIAFDKDEEAITHSRTVLGGEQGTADRIRFINDSFVEACSVTKPGGASGLLLDLGLSSHQLDEGGRGFSFRFDGPIDMRFGQSEKSAEDLINAISEEELTRIFFQYGEEPFARVIARRIVQIRRAQPFKTTFDLRRAIEQSVPPKFLNKTLMRIFQGIRIAVNDELGALEYVLRNFPAALESGGRIVVIAYHSLEDRIVKNIFREKSKLQSTNQFDNTTIANTVPELKILTPKPIIPTDEEIEDNPRARSAKMRVAEKR